MAIRKLKAVEPIQVGSPDPSPWETAANRAELARNLRRLRTEYIECRDLLHAWEVTKDGFFLEENRKGQFRAYREMDCLRCGTHRKDYYKIGNGGLVKLWSHYNYPEGYEIPKSPPGTKPLAIVRAESLRRATGIEIKGEEPA